MLQSCNNIWNVLWNRKISPQICCIFKNFYYMVVTFREYLSTFILLVNRTRKNYFKLHLKKIHKCHFTPIRMAKIWNTDISDAGKDVEKKECSSTVGGNANCCSHLRRPFQFLTKLNIGLPCNPTTIFLVIYLSWKLTATPPPQIFKMVNNQDGFQINCGTSLHCIIQ